MKTMLIKNERKNTRTKQVEHLGFPNMVEEIRSRAYEIYESRGRQDGRDLDDWIQAENELRKRQIGKSRTKQVDAMAIGLMSF